MDVSPVAGVRAGTSMSVGIVDDSGVDAGLVARGGTRCLIGPAARTAAGRGG